MVIQYIVLLFILCAFICLNQVVIHETGHYLCIKKWARKLSFNFKDTYIRIGNENSKLLCNMGKYKIMTQGCTKTGITVSSFYKKLAECENDNKIKAIKANAAAGAKAIMYIGLILLATVFTLNVRFLGLPLNTTCILSTMSAGIFICFVAFNSLGSGNEFSDFYFWNNPQKFIDFFKD